MKRDSRIVSSNQCGLHPKLVDVVERHRRHRSKRPVADHARQAVKTIKDFTQNEPFILDSCCGTGQSSHALAQQFPDHRVIGVDRSLHRLARAANPPEKRGPLFLRTNIEDLLPLMVSDGLRPATHYLLYPNPWPKAKHLQRRFHAMPVLRDLVLLGGRFEVRSNWLLYLEEMQTALSLYGVEADIVPLKGVPDPAYEGITAFETKYARSGQPLCRLNAMRKQVLALEPVP